jgi:hypothetical protein
MKNRESLGILVVRVAVLKKKANHLKSVSASYLRIAMT